MLALRAWPMDRLANLVRIDGFGSPTYWLQAHSSLLLLDSKRAEMNSESRSSWGT